MGNLLEVITEGGREAPCTPRKEGVFLFPCHKGLFSSDGVLVAHVLPRTWLRECIRGKVLLGATQRHFYSEAQAFHCSHPSPPMAHLVQSAELSEGNSRHAFPVLIWEPIPHLAGPT